MRLLPFLLIVLLFSCKAAKEGSILKLSETQNVVFMDSLQASKAIIVDSKEHFFEKITDVDMAIQMKENLPKTMSRSEKLTAYRNFLKEDVISFTNEDMTYLKDVFKEVYESANKINPTIFPKKIRLIKTHAEHYGGSVYYTREDIIVIPKNVLAVKNYDAIVSTIYHELAHIYSRYNEDKRHQLYDLVGFKNIGDSADLEMSPLLRKRILHNPDGINFAYKIDLKISEDSTISAIPIIASNEDQYENDKNTFFAYLDFKLYQVVPKGDTYEVITDEDGKSTLNLREIPDFFRQITQNTDYIIHPDEIIADNFMFLLNERNFEREIERFSEEGKQLLKDMMIILEK